MESPKTAKPDRNEVLLAGIVLELAVTGFGALSERLEEDVMVSAFFAVLEGVESNESIRKRD